MENEGKAKITIEIPGKLPIIMDVVGLSIEVSAEPEVDPEKSTRTGGKVYKPGRYKSFKITGDMAEEQS